jgi:hypothetical protein
MSLGMSLGMCNIQHCLATVESLRRASKATGVSSSVSRGGSRRLGRRVEEENDWNETS